MSAPSRPPRPRWRLALPLAFLAGCASMTPPVSGGADTTTAQQLSAARAAESKGNLLEAAQKYQHVATLSTSPMREDYLLRAAATYLRANAVAEAKTIMQDLPLANLPLAHRLQGQLVLTRIALSEKAPLRALKTLEPAPANTAPAALRREYHLIKAEAHDMARQRLDAARERVLAEPLLTDAAAIQDNQQKLWRSLQFLSPQELQAARNTATDTLSGWAALALEFKAQSGAPARLTQALQDWRNHNGSHPAARQFVDTLMPTTTTAAAPPATTAAKGNDRFTLALLLPLSGTFSGPATAIRDGFLAAHYAANRREQTVIRIYDTAGDPQKGVDAYRQAVNDGADMVVGPLEKTTAEAIAGSGRLPVPTLALNYLASDAKSDSQRLFQYGLAPEDEAREVAERAWLDGHTRALALIPGNEWGNRMLAGFEQQWKQLGGSLVDVVRYDQAADFNGVISKLLKFNPKVDARVASPRRQDMDFVFVAAYPRQARQIRPQMKFFYAGDVPVYATSHVYGGQPDPTQDQDMDGILFCDMPWIFTEGADRAPNWDTINKTFKGAAAQKRLYAMGIDAYALAPWLRQAADQRRPRLRGESGELYLDTGNRIHRQLQWARFVDGVPQPLADEEKP